MRRLIVVCLLIAVAVYALGAQPAAAAAVALALFFFLGFVRGHFDPRPNEVQSYGFAPKRT